MTTLAPLIDHTALKPTVTETDIRLRCEEALKCGFRTVCVPPTYVEIAVEGLQGSSVGVCTVVGFPLGYQRLVTKVAEAVEAIEAGASEVDFVINLAQFKSGNASFLKEEVEKMAQLVHDRRALVKVIIETAYLDREEIRKICDICAAAEVDFVKTSTGFAPQGAQVDKVRWMREILPVSVQVKASGGIQTFEQALELIDAGATRLGTSSGVALMQAASNRLMQ